MTFRVLGPVQARLADRRIDCGPARQRCVLAALLVDADRLVAVEQLVDRVWGDDPPRTARDLVYVYVSRLRRAVSSADGVRLARASGGYRLQVGPDAVDLHRFRAHVAAARAAREAGSAVGLYRRALRLWRAPALADLSGCWVERIRDQLERERLTVVLQCVDAELACGHHLEVLAELHELVAAHPLDERIAGRFMLAAYHGGRRAEAVTCYRQTRQRLADELGVDPGPELDAIHRQVLGNAATVTGTTRPVSVPVPAELPPDVDGFVGRHAELAELDRPGALCAIVGTAGVGKTALAVHWAHRACAAGRFPDGQLYVNLRGFAPGPPLRPIQALAGLLLALGVAAEAIPTQEDPAANLYRSRLAGRRMLLVLDNAASAAQVRPLLPGGPHCRTLVISRNRLTGLVAIDGAGRISLDVLSAHEANALLAAVLGSDRVAAEPDAIAHLADVCARLPLALRIAAANLSNTPGRSVRSYLTDLRDGDRLTALAADHDERSAVRAAFDQSYRTLADGERRLFRTLGLVPLLDVTAPAAAALVGAEPERARRELDRLAAANLVTEPEPGRYTMHDLLRRYAADRARADDSPEECGAARQRLLDWYLYTVDAAARLLYPEIIRLSLPGSGPAPVRFDDPGAALAWIDSERANLVAAIRDAAVDGPRPAAWLLADALRYYFLRRMYTVDWLAVAHASLSAAEAEDDLRAQAAAHLSIGTCDAVQSRHESATTHLTRALALSREAGWLECRTAALGNLANVHERAGRIRQAIVIQREALDLERSTGRHMGQAIMLNNLASAHLGLGRPEQAEQYGAQALSLNRQIGSRAGESAALCHLAEAARCLGQFDLALRQFDQALAICRGIGYRVKEAEVLCKMASVHRDAGRLRRALDLARSAVAIADDLGEVRWQADTVNTLGTICCQLGEHDEAGAHHERALRVARDVGERYPQAQSLLGLATVNIALRQPDQAIAFAYEALAIARQGDYRLLEGTALTSLAAAHTETGDLARALHLCRQAHAVHVETGHRLGAARALETLARALRHTGNATAADEHQEEARVILDDIGSPR